MAKRPRKPRKLPDNPNEYPGEQSHHHHHRKRHTHAELVELVIALENQIMALSASVTAAFDQQDAKIADVSTKVDAFIASHQGNQAADDQAVVDRVTAQGQAVDAISAKLV